MKLSSIGIRNLKSFGSEKQMIDLKPINILVGKNSSGKSTFLRTLPLFKQSMITRTSKSPILWNGEFVDFGDFNIAVNSSKQELFFDFKLEEEFFWEQEISVCEITLGIHHCVNNSVSNSINIKIDGLFIEIKYDENYLITESLIKINDIIINEDLTFYKVNHDIGFFVKSFIYDGDYDAHELSWFNFFGLRLDTICRKVLDNIWKHCVDDWMELEGIEEVVYNMIYEVNIKDDIVSSGGSATDKKKMLSIMLDSSLFLEESYSNITKKVDGIYFQILERIMSYPDEIQEIQLCRLVQKQHLRSLETFSNYVENIFKRIQYHGPMRQGIERYTINRNVNVDEIESFGKNLAIYLSSLTSDDLLELNSWLMEHFQFTLTILGNGTNIIEILLKDEEENHSYNIVDKGFGFSQLLPIIVSIWISQNNQRYLQIIYTIEQPELHLHPALQYKFGVMLASVIKSDKNNLIQFVIETHSKSIIDGLGDSIKEKVIDNEKVNIYIFDKNEERETNVQKAHFNEEGYLRNWPIGFFTP